VKEQDKTAWNQS